MMFLFIQEENDNHYDHLINQRHVQFLCLLDTNMVSNEEIYHIFQYLIWNLNERLF